MFRVPPLVVMPISSVPGEAPRLADSMMAPVTVSELFGLTTSSFMTAPSGSTLRHYLPAVRVKRLAAEISTLVGGQEHEGAHEVVGGAEALERQRGGVGALDVFGQRIEAGIDEPRRD